MHLGVMVEGQGEIESVPVVVRNILYAQGRYDVSVSRPMRVGGVHNLLNGEPFVRQFNYVANAPDNCGVLIVSDCDDGCPLEYRRRILDRIKRDCAKIDRPVGLVLINREFESLFLSQADHLAATCDYFSPKDARTLVDTAQQVRNAKGVVKESISDFSYKESRDQVKLAARLDTTLLHRHRAGRRLGDAVFQVLRGASDL